MRRPRRRDASPPVSGALGGAASKARYLGAGLFNTQGSQARYRAGNRGVTETMAAGVSAGVRANARSGGRMVEEMMARNRRLEDAGVIGRGLRPAPDAGTGQGTGPRSPAPKPRT